LCVRASTLIASASALSPATARSWCESVRANENGIPVVGVYETMPAPGYTYQTWMEAEVNALDKAVTAKVSTEHL
jgi:hypothetical protein